jgi:HAD superfamily hydrolase (TIGR01509 family)
MTSELYVARAQAQMDQGIAAIAGAEILIETALAQGFEICIGSNGERSSVIKSLKLAGLYDYFGGTESRIFTKIQVENAKPAPDLFLFAAAQMTALMGMGAAPKTMIVIEDSVAGVQAGVAANMRVWGYTGSHHDPEAHKITLLENGAERCFSSLIHISDELQGKKEFCSA